MIKNSILLVGAGGHSEACIDVIESQKKYKIQGVIGLKNEKNKLVLNRYKILGTDDDLNKLAKKIKNALITVGQIKSADTRLKIFGRLKKAKFNLPISLRTFINDESFIEILGITTQTSTRLDK